MSNVTITAKEFDTQIQWKVVGLDLAKHDLSLVAISEEGEVYRIERISYEDLLEKASNMSPTVFSLEPCNAMNWLCLQLKNFGHECRVISGLAVSNYVNSYFSGQKNDLNDAEALAFLALDNRVKTIRPKGQVEQDLLVIQAIREQLVKTCRSMLVCIKSIAQSLGVSIPKYLQSETRLEQFIEQLAEQSNQSSEILKRFLKLYVLQRRELNRLTKKLEEFSKTDEICMSLLDVPGIRAIAATRLRATLGSISRFKAPKNLVAYYGLVPRNRTTGHLPKMGRITKRGDRLTRTYLVLGANALLQKEKKGQLGKCPLQKWISKKRRQLTYGKLVVALAAKLLRIIWAMLTKEEAFNLKKAGLARSALTK